MKKSNNKPEAKIRFLPALDIEDKPGSNRLSFKAYVVICSSVLLIIALLFNAIFVPFQIEEAQNTNASDTKLEVLDK
jgi:hypothetical protein